MSEPIRSISEGTFVIGDTNGLTFEAGPGISVSQPSEGTVRIANDETVLFSVDPNSATTDDVTLSESRKNFDHIEIGLFDDNNNIFNFHMIPEKSACRGMGSFYLGSQWFGWRAIEVVASDDTTLTISDTPQISFTSTGAFRNFGHAKYGKIYKVIGINRKENA